MHQIKRIIIACIAVLASSVAAPLANASQREMPSLTILSDSLLSIPISQLANQYARIEGVAVGTVYNTPARHQKAIEDGEPADILITADSTLVERLKSKGLIDVSSPKIVASTSLVVTTAALSTQPETQTFESILETAKSSTWVVLSTEQFAEGAYSASLLTQKIPDFNPTTQLISSRSIKDALASIRNDHKTGLLPKAALMRTDLGYIPASPPQTIQYTALVVASENMERARKLLEFLYSPEASVTFKKSGFDKP